MAQPNACVSFVDLDTAHEVHLQKQRRAGKKSAFGRSLQRWIEQRLHVDWVYGGWMENRTRLLSDVKYLRKNKTFLHLGIDLSFDAGTCIFAIGDGPIVHIGTDSPLKGGWGGHVLQMIKFKGKPHLLIYCHLGFIQEKDRLRTISKGDFIGLVGNKNENGGWGPHLHLQLVSDVDHVINWAHFMDKEIDGYGKVKDIAYWAKRCPDPTSLIFA